MTATALKPSTEDAVLTAQVALLRQLKNGEISLVLNFPAEAFPVRSESQRLRSITTEEALLGHTEDGMHLLGILRCHTRQRCSIHPAVQYHPLLRRYGKQSIRVNIKDEPTILST
jgi:hypothetical protein